jgi:hypothetical protein
LNKRRIAQKPMEAPNPKHQFPSKFYMTGSSLTNDGNYLGLSSPLMGEDRGGGAYCMSPSPPPSPTRGEGDGRIISKVIPITKTGKESAGHLKLEFVILNAMPYALCPMRF